MLLNSRLGEWRGWSASPGPRSPPLAGRGAVWATLVGVGVDGSGSRLHTDALEWDGLGVQRHGAARGCAQAAPSPTPCPSTVGIQPCVSGPPSAPHSALLTPRLSPHHLLLPGAPRVLAPPRGKWAHCTCSWGQRGARNLKNQTWWRLQDSPPGPRTAPRAKGPPLTAAGEVWAPLRQP